MDKFAQLQLKNSSVSRYPTPLHFGSAHEEDKSASRNQMSAPDVAEARTQKQVNRKRKNKRAPNAQSIEITGGGAQDVKVYKKRPMKKPKKPKKK